MSEETTPQTQPIDGLIARSIKDVNESHGAAFYAAALASNLTGHEQGSPEALTKTFGGYLLEVSNVIRATAIESNTGITSSALQELAAHLEAASNCLTEGLANAKILDREPFLAALCNSEMLGNSVCHLAGMKKVEADERMLAVALHQAASRTSTATDLSDLV